MKVRDLIRLVEAGSWFWCSPPALIISSITQLSAVP